MKLESLGYRAIVWCCLPAVSYSDWLCLAGAMPKDRSLVRVHSYS